MALYRGTGLLLVKSRKQDSGAEARRAADEGAAALVKTEKAMCGTSDPDAGAFAEQESDAALGCSGARSFDGAEPERAQGAEIGPVKRTIDLESGS